MSMWLSASYSRLLGRLILCIKSNVFFYRPSTKRGRPVLVPGGLLCSRIVYTFLWSCAAVDYQSDALDLSVYVILQGAAGTKY